VQKTTALQELNDDSQQTLSLTFNDTAQNAIIGHLLKDPAFFIQSRGKLKPNYFNSPLSGKVYAAQLELFDEFKKMPSVSEIKNHENFVKKALPEETKRIYEHIDGCLNSTQEFTLPFLKKGLTDWLKSLLMKDFLRKSLKNYETSKVQDFFYDIGDLRRKEEDYLYEDIHRVDFSNAVEWIKDMKEDYSNTLTTGLTLLDRALLEGPLNGGLLRGDTTCLMGSTDAGKTSVMFSIMAHNLLANKNVMLMTHEGRPGDLKERLMCTMLSLMNVKENVKTFDGKPAFVNKMVLLEMIQTEQGRKRIKQAEEIMQQFLVYYPYNKPGMMVEDIEATIRRQQDKRATLTGKGFDLLVDDYPAKLSTRRASQGFLPPHLEKEVVYDYFVQLAVEFNLHSLVAVQSNREGWKQNSKSGDDHNLLGIDLIGDSYKISNIVTNFISINRSPDFANKNKMILYVCKSKNSKTGRAIVCKTAFGSRLSHADELGSVGYDNSVIFDNEIDVVMANKNNFGKILTTEELTGYSTLLETGGTLND
jgi:replicative DNA helicase